MSSENQIKSSEVRLDPEPSIRTQPITESGNQAAEELDSRTQAQSYGLRSISEEFANLRRLVNEEGLLARQTAYYNTKIIITISMLAASIAFLIIFETLWFQILNAVFLAFIFGQLAFIFHDAGHDQIYRGARPNMRLGFVVMLLLGTSRSWWIDKHNRHHANPNDVDNDPDVDFPVLGFSQKQIESKRGLARHIVKYQAFLFFPMLLFEGYNLRFHSINYLICGGKTKYRYWELTYIAFHLAIYGGLVFSSLPLLTGAIFIAVHHGVFGVYLGSAFAPNHKGMLVIDGDSKIDSLRKQILTTRNVRANRITDILMGPLVCQIEHHLFPTMPTNRLRKAQLIVKDFCEQHSIPYHETGLFQSFKEILRYLHEVSAPLRIPQRSLPEV